MNWRDSIDPATIPEDVLRSEIARRNAGRRKTFGGGRPRKTSPKAVKKAAALLADGLTWDQVSELSEYLIEKTASSLLDKNS